MFLCHWPVGTTATQKVPVHNLLDTLVCPLPSQYCSSCPLSQNQACCLGLRQLGSCLRALSHEDSNKGDLSCPGWPPVPSLPEMLPSMQVRVGSRALLGIRPQVQNSLFPQNRKTQPSGEMKSSCAKDLWRLEWGPSRLSCTHKVFPPVSGAPSSFLLFQNTPEIQPASLSPSCAFFLGCLPPLQSTSQFTPC